MRLLMGTVVLAVGVAAAIKAQDNREGAARTPDIRKEVAAMERGVLTVEPLLISQSSPSFTAIDIRFTNTSAQALSWWNIGVEVYDKDGDYLGRGDGIVTDIGPGQSQVHPVSIKTQATAINSMRATLGTVRGYGSLESLTPLYQLDLKTAPTKK